MADYNDGNWSFKGNTNGAFKLELTATTRSSSSIQKSPRKVLETNKIHESFLQFGNNEQTIRPYIARKMQKTRTREHRNLPQTNKFRQQLRLAPTHEQVIE